MNQPTKDIVAGNLKALTDTKTLRKRARQHVEEGAVTTGYAADREAVTQLLNEALATELVCVLRYKRHSFRICQARVLTTCKRRNSTCRQPSPAYYGIRWRT